MAKPLNERGSLTHAFALCHCLPYPHTHTPTHTQTAWKPVLSCKFFFVLVEKDASVLSLASRLVASLIFDVFFFVVVFLSVHSFPSSFAPAFACSLLFARVTVVLVGACDLSSSSSRSSNPGGAWSSTHHPCRPACLPANFTHCALHSALFLLLLFVAHFPTHLCPGGLSVLLPGVTLMLCRL